MDKLTQIPIGSKVKIKPDKKGTWSHLYHQVGTVVAAERIIKNKPHRIVHTVLMNGEDQYDFQNKPLTLSFTAPELILVSES